MVSDCQIFPPLFSSNLYSHACYNPCPSNSLGFVHLDAIWSAVPITHLLSTQFFVHSCQPNVEHTYSESLPSWPVAEYGRVTSFRKDAVFKCMKRRQSTFSTQIRRNIRSGQNAPLLYASVGGLLHADRQIGQFSVKSQYLKITVIHWMQQNGLRQLPEGANRAECAEWWCS